MGQRRGKAMNGTALRAPRERKTLYVLGILGKNKFLPRGRGEGLRELVSSALYGK